MTTMTMSVMWGFLLTWTIWSINPVKVSMTVLALSVTMFLTMTYKTGLTWFPMLMLMLFMGGIILMFMILSSVIPNEKSMKTKSQFLFVSVAAVLFYSSMFSFSCSNMGEESKSFLSSGLNFYLMMVLILTYFVGSMSTLSANQYPMRTFYCCKMFNLVNWKEKYSNINYSKEWENFFYYK